MLLDTQLTGTCHILHAKLRWLRLFGTLRVICVTTRRTDVGLIPGNISVVFLLLHAAYIKYI